jgi:broad specificity phosphatase PhoE
MKITYFVHGTTTDNETGKATGWLPGELSALGIQQAKDLPGMIKDASFTVMFSSDLQRAIDSAQLGFGKTHKLRTDERLREANYGDWNGGPHRFKDDMLKYVDRPFPNGGSYKDVETCMRSFIVDTKKELGHDAHIAIMAHEAPQLALEVIANGKSWPEVIDSNWRKTKSWQPGWTYIV